MPFITGCRVHFDHNISFGNVTDCRCSQCVFLPRVDQDIRPGDSLQFSCRFGFCDWCCTACACLQARFPHEWTQYCLQQSDKHSIPQIGLQRLAYPPTSISKLFLLFSSLVKHAFSDNSNLFSVARTSEKSQVLGISADICIIFPFRKDVLQQ